MAVVDAYVFPGFLTPVLTELFFLKPSTTFLTCFCTGERRKYAGKKSRLNRGSNSQPPGHEFDTLTTEPPGQGPLVLGFNATLTAIAISWRSVTHMFPDFLTPVLTQLFFLKSTYYFFHKKTTFLKCFCRGERRKYAGKKGRLNRGSNI